MSDVDQHPENFDPDFDPGYDFDNYRRNPKIPVVYSTLLTPNLALNIYDIFKSEGSSPDA